VLEGANRTAEGYNPLCGDQITLYLNVENGVIKDAAFQGKGCAISKASASLMTAGVIGKRVDEADRLVSARPRHADVGLVARRQHRRRRRQAGRLLRRTRVPKPHQVRRPPWHTLRAALSGAAAPVSTE
jgi:nitrogen fixation NifU-like protein